MSASTAKIVLKSCSLRWSSPIIFNDPFDVSVDMPISFRVDDFANALTERLARLIEHGEVPEDPHPGVAMVAMLGQRLPADKRQMVADELRREGTWAVSDRQLESAAMVRSVWKEVVEGMRILCLSQENDVTSMWNHYADQYSGVVLRLEVLDEIDSPLLLAQPIIYTDDTPPLGSVDAWVDATIRRPDSHFSALFEDYQYIKKVDWRYEKEWRIVTMAEPHEMAEQYSDWPLRPETFTDVYFGVKCGEEDRTDILSLLEGQLSHVRAWDAKMDVTSGKFSFDPL